MTDLTSTLSQQFEDAVALARMAHDRFVDRPMTRSRRSGLLSPSPWFKVWDLATQNMIRLARLLKSADVEGKSFDDELDDLIRGGRDD